MFITLFSCKKKEPIPESLKLAFEYLDKNWNTEVKTNFKNLKTKEYTLVYYGYAIEDELETTVLREHPYAEKLNVFFDSLQIFRSQNKSGLILNTYHNYINDRNIELTKEVDTIKNYWEPIERCEKALLDKALKNYHAFNVADTLIIRMPVSEHNNAIDFNCPYTTWQFKEDSDLEVIAVVLKKYISQDSSKANFELKLSSKNKPNTEILYQELYKGDTFTISLNNSWHISKRPKKDETADINL